MAAVQLEQVCKVVKVLEAEGSVVVARGWWGGTVGSHSEGIMLNGYRRIRSRQLLYHTVPTVANMMPCTSKEGDLMVSVYTTKIGTQRFWEKLDMFITLVVVFRRVAYFQTYKMVHIRDAHFLEYQLYLVKWSITTTDLDMNIHSKIFHGSPNIEATQVPTN